MGEYARFRGQEIKIGTCESMYYLRAGDASRVTALPGSVDPVQHRTELRFRFPFPTEDHLAPGEYDYPLPDVTVTYPAELVEIIGNDVHGTVSVETPQGRGRRMSAFLPCPSVSPDVWHQYVRGFTPAVRIMYQGERGDAGNLAVIVECAYCDGLWNLPSWDQAELLVVAIRSDADKLRQHGEWQIQRTHDVHGPDCGDPAAERDIAHAAELHTIADRITAGYAASTAAAVR